MVIKIFIVGWMVLLGALLANPIASTFGLMTWYEFSEIYIRVGLTETLQHTSWASIFFLVIAYPFLLGVFAYVGLKFSKSFDQSH